MWMNYEVPFFVIYAVLVQPVPGSYYVNRTETKWDYQNPPCKLATPEINYSSTGPSVIVPSDVTITSNERVLVGYTKTFEVFENVGCIWESQLPNHATMSTESDPGQCYSACETTHFGIHNTSCYCLSTALTGVIDTRNRCDTKCLFPENTVCGGKTRIRNFVSVYRRVSTDANDLDDGSFCRIYEKESGMFSWKNCDTVLRGICQKGTTTDIKEEYIQWYQYPKLCYQASMYPANENKSRIGDLDEDEVWIGRIRSWRITEAINLHADYHYGYYGYISHINDNILLRFTKTSTEGAVLCVKDAETTTTEASAEPTTTKNPKTTIKATTETTIVSSDSATSKTSDLVTSEKMSTTEHNVTVVTPKNEDKMEDMSTDETNSSGLIAVYVIVPLFLVIGAVAVIIIRWKRKQAESNDTENVISNGTKTRSSTENDNAIENDTYADDFAPTTPENESYDYITLDLQYENSEFHGTAQKGTAKEYHSIIPAAKFSCINDKYAELNSRTNESQAHDYSVLEKSHNRSNVHERSPDNADYEFETTKDSNHMDPNTTCDQRSNLESPGNEAHGYFVLEKTRDSSDTQETSHGNNEDIANSTNRMDANTTCVGGLNRDTSENNSHDYFVLETTYENPTFHDSPPTDDDKDAYDTTQTVKAIDVTLNANIYNRLSEFSEETYNHAMGAPQNVQITDNGYGCVTRDGDIDNVYNTACEGVGLGNQIAHTDNTYSHIR